MPCLVRHKDIVQFGCKGVETQKQEPGPQAHDEMWRTRTLNELMRTAEGKDRNERAEEMRQDKRARAEMDAGDGHDKPAEAKNEDEHTEEAQGDGQTEQSAEQQPQKR